VFEYEKFAKKVGHLRPRIVQIQLENYPDIRPIAVTFAWHRLRNASSRDINMSAAEQNPDHAGEQYREVWRRLLREKRHTAEVAGPIR